MIIENIQNICINNYEINLYEYWGNKVRVISLIAKDETKGSESRFYNLYEYFVFI